MAIIDDGFRFNTWWGIGDAWAAKTTYGTTNSDENRFYIGGSSTRGRSRLGFTIPTSYTGATSLIIGMRPDETATISYMRALLTIDGSISSNADIWASASILASSYFYSDINCTKRITGETINWVYCKLDYNFTPGTTYYVGIFPYAASTSIGNTNYNAVWFRGRNAADYLWSRLTYDGAQHTLTLNTTTGVDSFTGGGKYNHNATATTYCTPKSGYHLTKMVGTATDGSTSTWTECSGAVTKYTNTWTMSLDRTITAYADPNTYTIKYNGNGNTSGSTTSSTHTYDSSKALTTNGFTKTGYAFQGWATSASGPVVYTNGQSVKNITSTNGGVINLYAVWTANTYTIKYNGNGNTSGSTSSSTHTYDESKPLTENRFTKTGYAFEGWSLNPSGPIIYMNRQIVKNLTAVNNNIIDLYANWVICKKGKDIIPFIYTGSANQMMMPKIFYNGEWRWFLINILPEQIVAAKAFVNIDSDAIIDSY